MKKEKMQRKSKDQQNSEWKKSFRNLTKERWNRFALKSKKLHLAQKWIAKHANFRNINKMKKNSDKIVCAMHIMTIFSHLNCFSFRFISFWIQFSLFSCWSNWIMFARYTIFACIACGVLQLICWRFATHRLLTVCIYRNEKFRRVKAFSLCVCFLLFHINK